MTGQVNKQIGHPPTETNLLGADGRLHPTWLQWINTLKPTLEAHVTNERIAVSRRTTAERDAMVDIENGYEFYNTTLHKKQIRENGAWKTVTTT